MSSITVVGSINMDIVAMTDKYPSHGETVFGNSMVLFSGGKGANQATACAKLGKKVYLIGAIGEDAFGAELTKRLVQNCVDTTLIKIVPNVPTGSALITVDSSAENTMLVIKGANDSLTAEDILERINTIEDSKVLLIQMEIPVEAVIQAMKAAKRKGMFVILDPAPAEGIVLEALQYADIITPNLQETYTLTGIKADSEESAIKAVEHFHLHFGMKKSIIKMGGSGLLLYDEGKTLFIPPLKVKAIDTVGAGDSFAGALACAIADGKTLEEAAKFAVIVSGIKVTRKGAQDGIPTLEEVKQYCKENGITTG
ncbi:ribokinase [Aeribacillus sp. FSL K6-2848]|uniref:ribokinase n=1 Tax=Aeribacillus sp. FSL K6-2848 TaxID=2954612 RepID=UPI0030F4F72B